MRPATLKNALILPLLAVLIAGAEARQWQFESPTGMATLNVYETGGESYVDLTELATALGVTVFRDSDLNQMILAPDSPSRIAFIPGFTSFRYAGSLKTWGSAPIEWNGRFLIPLSLAEDFLVPAFTSAQEAVPTPTPATEEAVTPMPTAAPWMPAPSPAGDPYSATASPFEVPPVIQPIPTRDLARPTPGARIPGTGDPASLRVVFVHADSYGNPVSASPEAESHAARDFARVLTDRIAEKLTLEGFQVVTPQVESGVPLDEMEIASQANAAGAGFYVGLRARLSDRPMDYTVFHFSPLVAPGSVAQAPPPDAEGPFGIPWGHAEDELGQQSATFARHLHRHLDYLLGRKGKGIRQGRLLMLAGLRMPGLLLDIRPDTLFTSDRTTADRVANAIVYAIIDTRNEMEGLPSVPHY